MNIKKRFKLLIRFDQILIFKINYYKFNNIIIYTKLNAIYINKK